MEKVFTVNEFAKKLRISPVTTYKMIRRNEIGFVKCGASYRIPESAILAFLRRGAEGASK